MISMLHLTLSWDWRFICPPDRKLFHVGEIFFFLGGAELNWLGIMIAGTIYTAVYLYVHILLIRELRHCIVRIHSSKDIICGPNPAIHLCSSNEKGEYFVWNTQLFMKDMCLSLKKNFLKPSHLPNSPYVLYICYVHTLQRVRSTRLLPGWPDMILDVEFFLFRSTNRS